MAPDVSEKNLDGLTKVCKWHSKAAAQKRPPIILNTLINKAFTDDLDDVVDADIREEITNQAWRAAFG